MWNGSTFSALGEGLAGSVFAVAAFDDGSGPALFAGGSFWESGEQELHNIAKWDGRSWSPLGQGVGSAVYALEVFDDGSGPALYAGGTFSHAGGMGIEHIARWDGRAWSSVGGGTDGSVYALKVFDDGRGPSLYAAGDFAMAAGAPASHIARWDGRSWSALGEGLNDIGRVGLAVFEDGHGPALYVGSRFTEAGGQPASNIARWDGLSWSPLGEGVNDMVTTLLTFDDGRGAALYVGGDFTEAGGREASRIARWDGKAWSPLGEGIFGSAVWALAGFDDGSGPALFAGGWFDEAGGIYAQGIARWEDGAWSSLERGTNGNIWSIRGAQGSGMLPGALYVGGLFDIAGGRPTVNIARWDGQSWSALNDDGSATASGWVTAIEIFDEPSGPAVFAGGNFVQIGNVPANNIARWDGVDWSDVAGGTDGWVRAMGLFDDGSGPALYVGGDFSTAGGQAANSVVRWDGHDWSSLGDGLEGEDVLVRAFAVFDDGSGEALYVGGHFEMAGGVSALNVARWDGRSWSAVGDGLEGTGAGFHDGAWGLGSYDDGTGRALYAGGHVRMYDDDGFVIGLLRWNGDSWSPVPGWGIGLVFSLRVVHDGVEGSPALYVGGGGTLNAGEVVGEGLLRYDGSWSVPAGPLEEYSYYPAVLAMDVFDEGLGEGPSLFVAGDFDFAGGLSASNIARLIGCAGVIIGDLDGDGDVDGDDLEALLADWGPCPGEPVSCPADLNGDGKVSTADLLMLLGAWT
jgi:hypothetical protein